MYEEREYTHECVDCKARSPAISEGDTFLSTKFGWRLHRFAMAGGGMGFEWRCPGCWQRFKSGKQSGADTPPPSSGHVAPISQPSSDSQPRESLGRYTYVADRPSRGDKPR